MKTFTESTNISRASSFIHCRPYFRVFFKSNKYFRNWCLSIQYPSFSWYLPISEAATHRCSWKKVFWKYAANLQENTHAKCDFNKVAKQLYWNHTSTWVQSNVIEIALRHGCSPVNLLNLLHIFRTPFPGNTSGWLLSQFSRAFVLWQKNLPITNDKLLYQFINGT